MKRFLSVLSIFLTAAALRAEMIYDFTHDAIELNTSLSESRRGVIVQRAVDGVRGVKVDYKKFVNGNASWPYIATAKNSLKSTDWSKFAYCKVSLANVGSANVPRLIITVRDNRNKQASFNFSVAAGKERDCYIPVKALAQKIDIKNIAKVDIAISKPGADYTFRIYSIELVNQTKNPHRKAAKDSDIVRNFYDLRPDILKAKVPAWYNASKISGTAQRTIISVKAYDRSKGSSNYGFTLAAADGALNAGNLAYMTHISYEFEAIADEKKGGYIGFTLADNLGSSMWCGIGVLGKGYPARGRHQLWDTTFVMSNLKHLAYSYSSPFGAQTYEIKKFRFEFDPAEVMRQLNHWRSIVARQNLSDAEKAEFAALNGALDAAYSKVQGDSFRRGDAIAFNQTALKTRREYRNLLRKFNTRVLAPATGKVFGVGIADSMDQVFLNDIGTEMQIADRYTLQLAANESEAFQVVIAAGKVPLTNAEVSVSDLFNAAGNKLNAEVAPVAFAQVKKYAFPQENIGWFPAYIREGQKSCKIAAGETVPFWVRITAAKGTQSGNYKGTVCVKTDQGKYEFPLTVRVLNFELPQGSVIPQMWHTNDAQYLMFYKYANSAELLDKPEAYRKLNDKRHYFIDKHAAYRIPYDQIYWGPSTKEYRKAYHEAVTYHNKKYGARPYTLFAFSVPNNVDKYFAKPGDPKLQQSLNFHKAQLDKWTAYTANLGNDINKGLYLYGFDESVFTSTTAAYLAMVHKNHPMVKTVSTGRYGDPASEFVKDLDVQVEVAMRYVNRPELVAGNRAAGKQVWWYICDYPRPPEPSLMLSVPGAVPRVYMSLMAEKYKPEGFLYWSSIYWRNPDSRNPKFKVVTDSTPRIGWQTDGCHPGDCEEGTLFAPAEDGRLLPSLRVENFRDGVEDQWYFELLRREMKKAGTLPPEVQAACEKALQVGDDLVAGSSNYVIDSKIIRAKRDELARCIELVRSLNK